MMIMIVSAELIYTCSLTVRILTRSARRGNTSALCDLC